MDLAPFPLGRHRAIETRSFEEAQSIYEAQSATTLRVSGGADARSFAWAATFVPFGPATLSAPRFDAAFTAETGEHTGGFGVTLALGAATAECRYEGTERLARASAFPCAVPRPHVSSSISR